MKKQLNEEVRKMQSIAGINENETGTKINITIEFNNTDFEGIEDPKEKIQEILNRGLLEFDADALDWAQDNIWDIS